MIIPNMHVQSCLQWTKHVIFFFTFTGRRNLEEHFPHHNWPICIVILYIVGYVGPIMFTPSIYQFVTTPRSPSSDVSDDEVRKCFCISVGREGRTCENIIRGLFILCIHVTIKSAKVQNPRRILLYLAYYANARARKLGTPTYVRTRAAAAWGLVRNDTHAHCLLEGECMAFLASGSDLTWQKHVQLAVSEDDTPVAKRALASTLGLGGLCRHNFEHNSTPEHKGITEHNRKKYRHIYQKITELVTVVTHRKSCFNTVLSDSLSFLLISAVINIIMW